MDSKLHTPLLFPTFGVVVGVVASRMLSLDLYAPLITVVIGGVLFLWRGWSVALLIIALGCGALRMSIEGVDPSGAKPYASVSRVVWSEDSFVGGLQSKAMGRIERLELSGRAEGLAKATILGHVGAITPDQRYTYGVSGAGHLLAVSGLHLTVIFLLLNFMLLPLVLLPRGHIIRGVVIVGIMWFYAAVVGFSPSVVRSVVMFSVLQAAWSMGRQYNKLNSLLLALLVGVVYSPMLLYSVGSQLSVISVAAILLWGMPLYR
ncbi:MAG: ComEC/Rec2 family competence protein, partial [Rikenellaceae bacterium]